MARWPLRFRAVLDEHFTVIVVVLVALAAAGGWVTYATHVSPDTTTVERQVSSWETTGQFTHSATVVENNSVFRAGTTLTNRSVYFTRVSPRLNGTYLFTYAASESGDLNQTVSVSLVVRSVEQREQGQNERTLWQKSRPLNVISAESVAPGETVRVPFSLDVSRVANRTERIREQLGGSPGEVEVAVRAVVDFRGTVNGNAVDRTNTYTLPVALEGTTYRPVAAGPVTERHESTRTVTVERTYGPLRRAGAPLLLTASLCALVGLGVGRHRDRIALSPAERELLAYEDDRADFDEWISTIQLPAEARELPRAEAASLGALVDFAIDTDNGVIEDPTGDAYYVVHGDYLYTYRPPAGRGAGLDPWVEGKPEGASDRDDAGQTDGETAVTAEASATDDGPESPGGTPAEE